MAGLIIDDLHGISAKPNALGQSGVSSDRSEDSPLLVSVSLWHRRHDMIGWDAQQRRNVRRKGESVVEKPFVPEQRRSTSQLIVSREPCFIGADP